MMAIANIPLLASVSLADLAKKKHPLFSISEHLESAISWLCKAQDSRSDGGVSEGYHLLHGWLPSYPETTGYIIESFFDYARIIDDSQLRTRAVRMADWLLAIQHEDGSIPDSYGKKKLVFDTGQVLYGLVRCFEETGDNKYKVAAIKAGDWLASVQELDGSWAKFAIGNTPHTYYSRVASSLLKLHKITKESKYLNSGINSIEWCLKQQQENGWFDKASFNLQNHQAPFTHTIAYTFDGIIESGIYLQEKRYLASIENAFERILNHFPSDACIPGTFDKNWQGDSSFSCLTGDAQLAINLFRLSGYSENQRYFEIARGINGFLRSKHRVHARNKNIQGAIAGSYPIWGKYIHYTYPNWAVKFFIDALILEKNAN
jgi:uncharacterized protein YyaL (SSP411 family)